MAMQRIESDQKRTDIIASKREGRGSDFPLPTETSMLNLEAEWKRQAENLAHFFTKELKPTPQEYIAGLPKFGPQPETFRGRFDIPVIVETRILLPRMLELAGIACNFDSKEVKDWSEGKFATPNKPYITWLQDGTQNLNRSVRAVRKGFALDERGGTVFDGIALYLRDPKILKHHYLDLPGSDVGPGSAPCLGLCYGRPGLRLFWVGRVLPFFRSVSCGRI